MIVKIYRSGTSFKGLGQYLTHDPKAETSQRVAWTHTLNTAHDDVPSAVDEMLWTARSAEFLKAEAGIRAGGRHVEKPVKHFSLNWHPSEEPTREQMIEAVESYVNHMGWAEHEAALIAHEDTRHPHVHVMLNRVNPSDGTALDDGYDKRRSQEWAFRYERLNGQVFCEQRAAPAEEREKAPTRADWEILKNGERQDEAAEIALRKFDASAMESHENRKIIETEEWKFLKAGQKQAREAFFAEGKKEYSEVREQAYREVREIFRDEWREFYEGKRKGKLDEDAAAEIKAELIQRQKTTLTEYRDEYSRLLREEREPAYRDLLAAQRDERADLRDRQEEGLRSPRLLDRDNEDREVADPASLFQRAALEVAGPNFERSGDEIEREFSIDLDAPHVTAAESARPRDPSWAAGDLAGGFIGAFTRIGEGMFDFLGNDAPKQRQEPVHRPAVQPREYWETVRDNPFLQVAEQARHAAIRQEEEARSRAWWDDRDRGRE